MNNDYTIEQLKALLLKEEIDEIDTDNRAWEHIVNKSRQALIETSTLSNQLLHDIPPSNAYLLEKRFPTKQTRLALEEPAGLPVSEVALIMFSAMIPHIIMIGIVFYLALVGF